MTTQNSRKHSWIPNVFGTRVKCYKCGLEVKASQARRGVGPCPGRKK